MTHNSKDTGLTEGCSLKPMPVCTVAL